MLSADDAELARAGGVVVTGLGAVGAFGCGIEALWQALTEQASNFASVTPRLEHLPDGAPVLAASAAAFDAKRELGLKGLRALNRESQLFMTAALQAVRAAELDPASWNPHEVGIYTGTSWSGLDDYLGFHRDGLVWGRTRVNPAQAPNTGVNSAAAHASIRLRARGANCTISSGTVSSLDAIGRALMSIRQGRVRYALAGGVDCLSYYRLRALAADDRSPRGAPRPYDVHRSLPAPGEAAAVLMLESAESAARRGLRPLARIGAAGAGFCGGVSLEAMIGGSARIVQQLVIASSLAGPDLVFGSGSGDRALDTAEARGLMMGLDERMRGAAVTSIDGCVGTCDGAAGALRACGAVLSLRANLALGTTGFTRADPSLDGFPVSARNAPRQARTALVFGLDPVGHVAGLTLEGVAA